MNQGPRYVRLMEKSRGQKSRATVPLRSAAALVVCLPNHHVYGHHNHRQLCHHNQSVYGATTITCLTTAMARCMVTTTIRLWPVEAASRYPLPLMGNSLRNGLPNI
jgi:hypothetical protein